MADDVRISERFDVATASILVRRGIGFDALEQAMAAEMPIGPRWTSGDIGQIIGIGPEAWLCSRADADPGWFDELQRRLAGLASVTDQTGAYRLFRLEGPSAKTLIQRGVSVDLEGTAFPAAAAAVTMIGHIDVIIRRMADQQGFDVFVYRSYAKSFLRWVDATAFGLSSPLTELAGAGS